VPAILRKGEGVFTPEQMRALGTGGGRPAVTMYVTNQIDSRTDQAQVLQAIDRGMQAAQAQLLEKMERGEV
jgi:hypothetical protein